MRKYILGGILLIVGFAIGLAVQFYYPSFPFENRINIVSLASLIVTIFLAIYIPFFLERNIHNKRNEKDVIIRKIEALQSTIKNVNQTVGECVQKQSVSSTNSYKIIGFFTTVSNELDTIITLTEICSKNKFKEDFEEIKRCRFEYKNIVTGGGFQKEDFKYKQLDKKEEENAYHRFDIALCRLIFKINGL